jgi:23S rRNA (uracil1939-C5)-methyltransferase
MAKFPVVRTTLDRIVGGGQSLGEHPDGRKLFVWGGLPGEVVDVQIIKKRSKLAEGRVVEVITSSHERVEPKDPQSYLSTSPWQIMATESELHYKAALIEEAFELHDIVLPEAIEVCGDNRRYNYRNKVEFSFYWDTDASQLELAFFIRGSKGKVAVDGTSLAQEPINVLARAIRDVLRTKSIEARSLKTLLIRCDVAGNCTWQLYVKDIDIEYISQPEAKLLQAQGGEIIYSDPKSPASRITERLATYGNTVLTDSILGIEFNYATEGFFQVNIPLYEMALRDMQKWLHPGPVLDMYSGVGTIGLTIGGTDLTLVELDPYAALEHISPHATIILDPPRAGLHPDVIHRLVEQKPSRIIYLSCNPVTQARDVALLAEAYGIRAHTGYNFFPATPHIEHLVVLDLNA